MDEYQRGLIYTVAKASKEESMSGIPMKVIKNEPFDNELGKGIFHHRIIYLTNRLPDWARKILIKSGSVLQVEEKSWNAFPYIKTVYTSPMFSPDKFEVIVESYHAEDSGTSDNVTDMHQLLITQILKLPKSKLSQRVVDEIDVVKDAVDPRYYKQEEDPSLFKSKKTNRGPLKKGWQYTTKPVMCAYKLVTVNFAYWGLRTKVEKLLQDVIRGVYLSTHRQAFCWMDEWYDLSYEKVLEWDRKYTDSINKTSKVEEEEKNAVNVNNNNNNGTNNNSNPHPTVKWVRAKL